MDHRGDLTLHCVANLEVAYSVRMQLHVGTAEPIRAWAVANGIKVPSRGRLPAAVERQYNEATQAS